MAIIILVGKEGAMKLYVFANGQKSAENLSGAEIKTLERAYGKLIKVVIGQITYSAKCRSNSKPLEEQSWYKRREEQRRKNAKN